MIADILECRTISVVGLAKNAGKTECVNYILRRLKDGNKTVAVTSIGIDGECNDLLSGEPKPRITVYEGMLFVTTEKNFRESDVTAEILEMGRIESPLGKLVTARALMDGQVILSGPSDTVQLKSMFGRLAEMGVDITIADGALSRLSSSSPVVTDAMLLATGASVGSTVEDVVERTGYIHDLAMLPQVDETTGTKIRQAGGKPCVLTHYGVMVEGESLESAIDKVDYVSDIAVMFLPGAVTERLLDRLGLQVRTNGVKLVAGDYTKILAGPDSCRAFRSRGAKMEVLERTRLLGVCINPYGGQDHMMDGAELLEQMRERLTVPVYNIRSM